MVQRASDSAQPGADGVGRVEISRPRPDENGAKVLAIALAERPRQFSREYRQFSLVKRTRLAHTGKDN